MTDEERAQHNKSEESIQAKVDEALIKANMNPHAPFDVVKMADALGFSIRGLDSMPKNVLGTMILGVREDLRDMLGRQNLIVLNPSYDDEHLRFTIAHELGHFFMHTKDNLKYDDENGHFVFFQMEDDEAGIERDACKFAAMLLMDEQQFTDGYNELMNAGSSDVGAIRALAAKFGVPQMAVKRRIAELKLA